MTTSSTKTTFPHSSVNMGKNRPQNITPLKENNMLFTTVSFSTNTKRSFIVILQTPNSKAVIAVTALH